MASILVPVLYLTIIIGGLFSFSYFYRKRTAAKQLDPWFASHPERNTYVTLLQQSDPPASDALLKAALIRRAMTDVTRVLRLREDKPALQALLQKGSIGDDLWNSFLAAEKEMETEILEVMYEANTFVQGWGQIIFNTAGEMVQNEKLKAVFDDIPKIKAKQDLKYASKKRKVPEKLPLTPAPPATPSTPAKSAAPVTPATPAHFLSTPLTSSTNGLAPPTPSVADSESVTSMSDGELVSTPTSPSKSGRSTPSKSSSSKKGKKRK